jgi:hypothetical protein
MLRRTTVIGPCHVSGIFLPLRVNNLPLATIYEVKIPLRKWKKSLLQRNPAQMTWAIASILILDKSKKSNFKQTIEQISRSTVCSSNLNKSQYNVS